MKMEGRDHGETQRVSASRVRGRRLRKDGSVM